MVPLQSRRFLPLPSRWTVFAAVIAGLVLFPIASLFGLALFPRDNIWPHLWATVLPRYLGNTVILVACVGLGAMGLGTGLAWLVTHFRFPGRAGLQYAVLLPLAVPGYIGAYALVDALEYAGPVQTMLRHSFGWDNAADYWFPEVRTLGAAIFVLVLTLYPYVYLLARAAFKTIPASAIDVAQAAGLSPWRRVLAGVPALCPPRGCRRHRHCDDGGSQRFRHRGFLRGANPDNRHLFGVVRGVQPRRRGGAGPLRPCGDPGHCWSPNALPAAPPAMTRRVGKLLCCSLLPCRGNGHGGRRCCAVRRSCWDFWPPS